MYRGSSGAEVERFSGYLQKERKEWGRGHDGGGEVGLMEVP